MTVEAYLASLPTCTLHSDSSLAIFELKTRAEQLIAEVQSYLDAAAGLDEHSRLTLQNDIALLQTALTGYIYAEIEPLVTTLANDFEQIKGAYPLD